MKILRATTEAQDILFTPRINASVVSLRIRGDADASDVVLPNVLTSIKGGYHVVCVVVDLQENNYYSLDITFEDELIYRDRIFVTNQDLNKFSQDVGNRDTYTYYTDNTPIENNNNRLLTSLCSSIMADNGIYEPCENDINMSIDLNGLTLFFNPRGYKEGVLYNTLPYNNTGNFSYSRSNDATRKDINGNTQILLPNVPQLDNSNGCPVYISEPQRTNLFINSEVGATQDITLINDSYTISFEGEGSVSITGGYVLNGTGVNERVNLTFLPSAGVISFTVTGLIKEVNVELGDYSTSWIPTSSTAMSRSLPLVTSGGYADVFNSSNGILVFRGKALIDNGTQRFISVNNGTTGNRVGIGFSSSGLIQVIQNSGGGTITSITYNPPTITEDSIIAVRYFNTTLEIWMNGVMVANTDTATPLPSDILTRLDFHSGGGASRFEGIINWIAYYNVLKTDEEMANLTSL